MSLDTKHDHYQKCVSEWADADRECSRLYGLWQEASERRRRLAKLKNAAWREYTNAIEQRPAPLPS